MIVRHKTSSYLYLSSTKINATLTLCTVAIHSERVFQHGLVWSMSYGLFPALVPKDIFWICCLQKYNANLHWRPVVSRPARALHPLQQRLHTQVSEVQHQAPQAYYKDVQNSSMLILCRWVLFAKTILAVTLL